MTRINVVPVKELCNQHLFAEWREMPRLRKYIIKSMNSDIDIVIPEQYKMGQGHVKFFYNKLAYICKRHKELTKELIRREYDLSNTESLLFLDIPGLPTYWFNDWIPTETDMEINRERLKERMPKEPRWERV